MNTNIETVKPGSTVPPAIPDELLEDDRKAATKKAAAARLKARVENKDVKEKQFAVYDDAYNDLTLKISNTRILAKLLAGAGRESLSEADSSDLDAMLLTSLEAIEEAALAVGDALQREGVWA